MMLTVNIIIFLLMQIAAALLFKWGATRPELFWYGFGFGNMLGVTSIFLMMYAYKYMQANLAAAVCVGGSYMLIQLALAVVFRTNLSMMQWLGILLMVVGIGMIALFPRQQPEPVQAEAVIPPEM